MCGTRFSNIHDRPALFEITSKRTRGSAPARAPSAIASAAAAMWTPARSWLTIFTVEPIPGVATMTMQRSASAAASAALAAARPPALARRRTASARTSKPSTSNPAWTRRAAMPVPIAPSPMKPMRETGGAMALPIYHTGDTRATRTAPPDDPRPLVSGAGGSADGPQGYRPPRRWRYNAGRISPDPEGEERPDERPPAVDARLVRAHARG